MGRKALLLGSAALAFALLFSCKTDAGEETPTSKSKKDDAAGFEIIYILDGGTNNADNPAKYTEKDLPLTLKAPSKAGFTFEGWFTSASFTQKSETIAKGATGKKTFYAKWAVVGGAQYTARHKWEKADAVGYDDTDVKLTGKAGEDTKVVAETKEGFHLSATKHPGGAVTQQKVKADGSTVVEIFYDRDQITLTFDAAGGSAVPEQKGKFGATLLAPVNPTKTGFTFAGWEPPLPQKFPLHDMKYTAKWTANAPGAAAQYTVNHWTQKLNGKNAAPDMPHDATNYEQHASKKQSGAVGTKTNAQAESIEGFSAPASVTQETIKADGSTVVNLYYTRKSVTLTFKAEGGTPASQAVSGKFGETLPTDKPVTPTKTDGGKFSTWYPVPPATFPAADAEFTANWTTLKEIEVTHLPNKTVYAKGEPFAPAGLQVKAKYEDGSSRILMNSEYTTDFDTVAATAGENKDVTVTYMGKTATFKVSVKEPVTNGVAVGDIVDAKNPTDIKTYKPNDFTKPEASAPKTSYYVVVSVSGAEYTAIRLLDNGAGTVELKHNLTSTYSFLYSTLTEKRPAKQNIKDTVDAKDKIITAYDKIGLTLGADVKSFDVSKFYYYDESGLNWYDYSTNNPVPFTQWSNRDFIPVVVRTFTKK